MTPRTTGTAVKIGVATLIVICILVFVHDSQIEDKRDDYRAAVESYEQSVAETDAELQGYETEKIDLKVLTKISKRQKKVLKTSKLLLGLDINTWEGANSYNKNILTYQSQMSKLNDIVDKANKTYSMTALSSIGALENPPTEKKITEMVGLEKQWSPDMPQEEIVALNQTIDERYAEQKALRDKWNKKAAKINKAQDKINKQRDKLYDLYGTSDPTGIHVERGDYVRTN